MTPKPTASGREGASAGATIPGDQPPTKALPPGRPGRQGHASTRERAFHTLAALALGLLVAVSFFPATNGGFVWDDVAFTEAWPIKNLSGIWQIWFEPRTLIANEAHYWPVLYTTLWLDHVLWGLDPAGYHTVNVLLHLTVTLLLWRLLLRLAVPGAWVAAAVFAVHPLHVESTAWVIGRKDLLASLFYLACVLTYLRFVADRRRGHYVGAMVLFVLGLLSKAIVVTLPVSLLIWHWWKQGRITRTDVARVVPFLVVGLCIVIADWSYYKGRDDTAFDYSLIQRALIAAHALWFYVGKLVWPTELAVIYPRWDITVSDPLAWGYVLAVIAVAVLLWNFQHRIGRGPLAGALFFVVTLSPTLSFVDYGYMSFSFVADRYQYLAGSGVIAVLVGAAAHGTSRLPGPWRMGVQALTVVPLVILGTITWYQAGIYRDNATFYTHVASINPKARLVHLVLGLEHHKQGRYDEALAAYRTEYRLAQEQQPPDQYRMSNAHLGIGSIAEKQGRLEEAEEHYRSGITFPEAFHRLTALLVRQKRHDEALELYQSFVEKNPGSAKLQSGMGEILLKLNQPAKALRRFERALELDPYMEEAKRNRERALKALKNQRQ